MFIPEGYLISVILCIVTMLCWGSWANTQKLASKAWRFELFYWDYVLGILLLSILFSFTLGSSGELGRNFLDDIAKAEAGNISSAIIGGIIFNAANILLVAAISIAGMSVAFPVAIGIALVLGVFLNYIAAPVGNPYFLFMGVGLIAAAIILDAIAYKKLMGSSKGTTSKGIVVSVISGVLMGVFYRFVADSMATDFQYPEVGKLTPYTAVFCFCIGVFLSNFLFNGILMKKPIKGPPVSIKKYFKGNSKDHLMGILGGVIWCIGMSLSILASGEAGYAISYGLGQGATLVAALWGVLVWREFKDAPKGTNTYLTLMFLCFLFGIGLIVYSRYL